MGRRKLHAGKKNKTLETWMRASIVVITTLTSHIQWHKLDLVHEWRAIIALTDIPIDGCTKRDRRLRRRYTELFSPCPRIAGNVYASSHFYPRN